MLSMTTPKSNRNTRSNKFPLTLHPTGRYCKKIHTKMYYFGKDRAEALQHYLKESSSLHTGRPQQAVSREAEFTFTALCSVYLEQQECRLYGLCGNPMDRS